MSDYRPWAPSSEADDPEGKSADTDGRWGDVLEGEAGDVDADPAEAAYTPWDPSGRKEDGPLAGPASKERRFEQPPGLGEAPRRRKQDGAHETAAAMLLWTGGFLLLTSIALIATLTMAIDIERIQSDGLNEEIREMETIRAYGWVALLASLLFLAPGIGLLYHQAWARPLGFVAASVTLLLGPVGLVLGIVALVNLSRMEGA